MDSSSSSFGVSHVNHISNPCIFGEVASSSSSAYREKKCNLKKWVNKLFKSGSNGGASSRSNHHLPHFQEEENLVSPLPASSLNDQSRTAQDKEELERTVSLPLADNTKQPHDLTKPIYGGLNPSSSFVTSYKPPYQSTRRQSSIICGGCNHKIVSGNYLGCMDTFFHPKCFRCYSCGYPITELEFFMSETKPYHKLCFKELTHPKCEVCHQFLPTNDDGLIEYRFHPFWNQKYCPSHETDNTPRCYSCKRLKSLDMRYYILEDGRNICMECMETAITDTGSCQPLYHTIRDYYDRMNMKLDQQIPMLLVQREALNDAIVREKNVYQHTPETKGACLSEEQIVSSVLRRPRLGADNRLVGMRTQPRMLTRRCEVTAILVIYGLPRVLTGAIIAHELMHGWLRLNGLGYRNLSLEVEEGICQVLTHMWLESEVISKNMPSSNKRVRKSNVEKKLAEYLMYQIAHDPSSAYGGGFREANAAVTKYGLRRLLDHIRLTGTFPL